MSLRCLAILGSKNEPLYICSGLDENDQNDSDGTSQQETDAFGFFGDDDNVAKNESFIRKQPSIRHEMMLHSAIDRIEELLGSPRKVTWKRFQRGSHWIGRVCPMEEYDIYGYVTTSDVKILALLDRDVIVPLKKRKEVDIKIMFTGIHDCYVKYTMNPFTKIRTKVQPPCLQFEKSLESAMDQYNNAVKGNQKQQSS
mmetsp:Transcript_6050/g.14659  ORF Transcript_6050/g.14659 Transcript_6050/m.14659 type:complete len:198 (+) Transcript_6050:268-861(+)|eukprot:CAMPEP_0116087186 /NCGR_PEP_ID=MMETSP0327-20121206/5236_1 /TAXON_ID=44447 /ORGANISM="Pseudo-nitzschia delicatissima, Strain B596" /LENGTH=197 /DNA_ID=CAMNT_0003578251 /DNA_START=186 /DNA_END=779 /DNA_ORIENTATION=+